MWLWHSSSTCQLYDTVQFTNFFKLYVCIGHPLCCRRYDSRPRLLIFNLPSRNSAECTCVVGISISVDVWGRGGYDWNTLWPFVRLLTVNYVFLLQTLHKTVRYGSLHCFHICRHIVVLHVWGCRLIFDVKRDSLTDLFWSKWWRNQVYVQVSWTECRTKS